MLVSELTIEMNKILSNEDKTLIVNYLSNSKNTVLYPGVDDLA